VPTPPPRDDEDFGGKFVVRVPGILHRDLVGAARRWGVSLNTLVVAALGKYLGAR
jgi:predicted HicB family RNase H-like nuclease